MAYPWWRYVLRSHEGDLSPWDRGVLEAHWMGSLRTHRVLERQAKAIQQRRGILTRLLPWRRKYLDGLIWGIERELRRREKD